MHTFIKRRQKKEGFSSGDLPGREGRFLVMADDRDREFIFLLHKF